MRASPNGAKTVTDPTGTGVRQTLAYHERTKHHLHRYARGPGHLDWATQPDPFRRFAGAPAVELPLLAHNLATLYGDLYVPGAIAPRALGWDAVAVLFELALGLSAWKQYGASRWALRCNPSSGNLHPTEGYAILPALPGIEAGVYHYVSRDHALERRRTLRSDEVAALPPGTFLVGLSSIHWREAWKYGERAFRYCQHDVGHALGTMRFAPAALGWKLCLLDRVAAAAVSQLLGLDREADYAGAEREHPELVALVVREKWASDRGLCLSKELVCQVATSRWYGTANVLSPEHGVDWPVIDRVAVATTNPRIAADEEFSRFPSEEEI